MMLEHITDKMFASTTKLIWIMLLIVVSSHSVLSKVMLRRNMDFSMRCVFRSWLRGVNFKSKPKETLFVYK